MHSLLDNSLRWRWIIVSLLSLLLVATSAPMASGQAQTDGCADLIVDSGFESGAGWSQESKVGYDLFSSYRVHSGQRAARLAGFNGADDRLSTTVAVPAESATLSFWWYAETEESGAGTDWLRVQIANTAGTPITTLLIVTDEQTTTAWQNTTSSLQPFAGQSIQIQFLAQNDESLETDFFIDDVVVTACTGGEDEFNVYLPHALR